MEFASSHTTFILPYLVSHITLSYSEHDFWSNENTNTPDSILNQNWGFTVPSAPLGISNTDTPFLMKK